MTKKKYTHIKAIEMQIISTREAGMTRQEIADELGLEKEQIKNWIARYNRRKAGLLQGMPANPKGRPRKRPLTTEDDYVRMIALSGLIVGISATFSMASSEFLAARSEGRSDALKSCSYTGIAYLLTVITLIAPYLPFPADQYIPALICMLVAVVLIIAGFTYYTSVAQDQPFRSRFLEMAGISLSVAVVSFVVGILAKQFLGVDL